MIRQSAAAILLGVLAGCAGGEGADTSAPTITVGAAGGRAFFSTDPGVGVLRRGCSGGLASAYAIFDPSSPTVHVRDGGAQANLTVTFSDETGIQRAFIQIPAGQLSSPQVANTKPIPTASGLSEVYEYNFFGQEGTGETSHRVTIALAHSDSNRVFNVFASDFAGNTSDTFNLLIGESAALCAG
ncbi:MAG: hypothetical protein AAGA32_05635 [Pseudomonadota bacterium]